jgi:hypothetical protein
MRRRGDFVHSRVTRHEGFLNSRITGVPAAERMEHMLLRSAVWLRNSWRNYTQMRFNLWTRLWPFNGTTWIL